MSTKDIEDKQPFMTHLSELRTRLLLSVIAVVAGFSVCFNYSEIIFEYLKLPMNASVHVSRTEPYISFIPYEKITDLVFLAPGEAFWVHMKVSAIAGLILAMPILFWQLWRFISPGLHRKEKRMALPFIFVTSGLFFTGTAFCFIVVLPFAMNFLLNFRAESLTPMISVERYVDFCLKFILAFGAVFELPVIIVFLTRLGVVSADALARNRKYALLGAFIVAALMTPTPDAFNQTLMAVPIIVLYEAGILASRIFSRRRAKRHDDQGQERKDDVS